MNDSGTILIYAGCYFLMFIITGKAKRSKSNRLFDTNGVLTANTENLIGLHLAGIIVFGVIPFALFKSSLETVLPGNRIPMLLWLLVLFFLVILISIMGFRASRRISIRSENIPGEYKNIFGGYFIVRIFFLVAYEYFFRGVVLFEGIKWIGVLPSILLSTGLTVLIHVFTNKKERWGCIPFGIILCSYCILLNAVWPAIVLHLALSLSYEIPPVYHFLKPVKAIR
ncbi:MAG TPA: CPBP family glutamic-type intramembrane protease [Chitinophagaceae bacterium]